MKYCRFETKSGPQSAPQLGEVQERDGAYWIVQNLSAMLGLGDSETPAQFEPILVSDVTLLPPVTPTKIVCVGRNYRDHAKELGNEVPTEPLLFFKPPSSLLAPGATILLPPASERVDFEGELAIVIAKQARHLHRDQDLRPFIHGFTLANDVTARDLQKKDGQWTRAKGFDTFCPVGPFLDTSFDLDLSGAHPLTIETHVNGELRQHGSTADFIFTLPILLEYITSAMTLEPGDLLLTGTPAGVGPLAAGDTVEISVPGLGRLSNPVAVERPKSPQI